MPSLLRHSLLCLTAVSSLGAIEIAEPERTQLVNFATEVYPFLKDNCIACHNASKAKAGLNLETPKDMLRGADDGPVLVPGKGMESLLLLVSAHLEEEFMPPENNKASARNLTPQELGLMKRWIDEGAKGEAPSVSPVELKWKSLPESVTPVYAVAVSPDRRFVAFNRGNRVLVYDVAARRQCAELTDPDAGGTAHLDLVQALAFSPDGLLASGGFQTIKLWRQPQSLRVVDLEALAASPTAVTAEGDLLAAGGADGEVVLWNLASKETKRWKEDASRVLAVRLADGKAMSIHENGAIRIVETAAANLPAPADAAAWLPDGRFAAVAPDGVLRLAKLVEGRIEIIREWPVGGKTVRVAAAAGQLVTAAEDGTARLWNADTGAEIRSIAHGAATTGLALSPSGTVLATGGANYEAKLWSTADGSLLHTLRAGDDVRRTLRRATSERDLANQVFETARQVHGEATKAYADSLTKSKEAAKPLAQAVAELVEKQRQVDAARALRRTRADEFEARKAAGDPRAGQAEAALKTATEEADKLGKELAAALKKRTDTRRNLDLATRDSVRAAENLARAEADLALRESLKESAEAERVRLEEAAGKLAVPVGAVAFSPDGASIAVACGDGTVALWSVETGEAMDVISAGATAALAFAPSGDVLSLGDKSATVWDADPAWRLERTIGGLEPEKAGSLRGRVSALAFSPDGQLLASGSGEASRSGDLMVWNPTDGAELRSLPELHSDTINDIAFSHDGEFVATASADRFARIVDTTEWKTLHALEGHTGHVNAVAWRADGAELATGSADLTVKIWNPSDGRQIRTNQGYGKDITGVAYLGFGARLVSACADKSLRAENDRFPDVSALPHCVAVSADGDLVVAGDENGVLTGWSGGDRKKLFGF